MQNGLGIEMGWVDRNREKIMMTIKVLIIMLWLSVGYFVINKL